MERRQLLGLLGAGTLFLGVFAPIISIPLAGSQNYFQNGQGDGTIIILLALVTALMSLRQSYWWLWFTGGASLAILAFTFISFQAQMNEVRSEMESELAGNPFGGLAELAMQSVQLQWGWAVLIIGCALTIAAAALKENPHTEPQSSRAKQLRCAWCHARFDDGEHKTTDSVCANCDATICLKCDLLSDAARDSVTCHFCAWGAQS